MNIPRDASHTVRADPSTGSGQGCLRQSKHERRDVRSPFDTRSVPCAELVEASGRTDEAPGTASGHGDVVDRPSRDRSPILFWIAYAGAWLALGTWLGLNVIIGHRNSGQPIAAWEPLTWELSSALVMGALAVFVYRFERRFPLSCADWLRRLPIHVPAAIVFSAIHTVGMVGIRKLVYAAHGARYDFGDP